MPEIPGGLNRWLIYAIALIFALSIAALEALIHCGL